MNNCVKMQFGSCDYRTSSSFDIDDDDDDGEEGMGGGGLTKEKIVVVWFDVIIQTMGLPPHPTKGKKEEGRWMLPLLKCFPLNSLQIKSKQEEEKVITNQQKKVFFIGALPLGAF